MKLTRKQEVEIIISDLIKSLNISGDIPLLNISTIEETYEAANDIESTAAQLKVYLTEYNNIVARENGSYPTDGSQEEV